MYKFGFIGTGNMASALAEGVAKSVSSDSILLADVVAEKASSLAKKTNAKASDNKTIAEECEFIVLGVKPQMLECLAGEIREYLDERESRFVLVSMAAGRSTSSIEELFGHCPVIRIMPNVPASVGEGMILTAGNSLVTQEEYDEFYDAMKMCGELDDIPEGLIDAASAVSGCGPAFVYEFIEALADGAVACGVPRDKAYKYAAQTLLGSAKLMLDTGKVPAELKDMVCSPGGTTIQGVRSLEKGAFRSSAFEAVVAAYEKTLNI